MSSRTYRAVTNIAAIRPTLHVGTRPRLTATTRSHEAGRTRSPFDLNELVERRGIREYDDHGRRGCLRASSCSSVSSAWRPGFARCATSSGNSIVVFLMDSTPE